MSGRTGLETGIENALVTRTPHRLLPDHRRVITRLFLPGQEMLIDGESRAAAVIERILALSDQEIEATVAEVLARFSDRHRHFPDTLATNYERVAHRLGVGADPPWQHRLLIGACFTHEYAVEAAALFNPSIVIHPDQGGLSAGEVRFVLSLRAVGEGHLSSLEFRTGIIGPGADVRIDDPGAFLVTGRPRPTTYDRALFHGKLAELGDDGENARFVLDSLPVRFTRPQLEEALSALRHQHVTRASTSQTIRHLEWIAACNYEIEFPTDSTIAERLIWPTGPTESHGIEDARFVRFTDDDATVTYYATYTAFDGSQVAPQLLTTPDFRTFRMSQLTGPAARNKGMALFPRRIDGQFVALSRWDRESTAIATSGDCRAWGEPTTLQSPEQPWELIQLGNCGSPIETPAGWLVLTHGVGPMRTYAIGAMLLDLHDPRQVLATLPEPLLMPSEAERDGYVPNVVYSCGGLLYEDTLVLPYGASDASVAIALVHLPDLLARLARG